MTNTIAISKNLAGEKHLARAWVCKYWEGEKEHQQERNCNTHAFINTQTGNTFVLTNTGSYAAIFTNGNCIDTTDCITYTGVNGVPPNAEANVLQIYPNPANEELTIETSERILAMQFSNVLGEIIFSQNYSTSKTEEEISVAELPSGIYFLKIQTIDGWGARKFVKQ